jgi:hypothetical protein
VPALQALALVAGLGDAAIDPAPPISSARHSSGGRS